jgi:hypothetical protein
VWPLLMVLGCGQASGPVSEAQGTITLNNKPVPNAEVVFMPDEGTKGPRSSAICDERGHFRLQTDDGRSGAVVGKHRVTVRTSPPREDVGHDGEARGDAAAVRPSYVPISDLYGKTDDTNPLGAVQVTPDKHTYDLDLK